MPNNEEVQIGIAIDNSDRQTAEKGDIREDIANFCTALGVEFIERQGLDRALFDGIAGLRLEGSAAVSAKSTP